MNMKRFFMILNLLLFVFSGLDSAQTVRSSWNLGFGFSYPRFQSTDVRPQDGNYGVYLSLQKYFSEKVALRMKAGYLSMEGRVPGGLFTYKDGTAVPALTEYVSTELMSGNIDVLYNLSPCSPVSPYLGLGIGITSFKPDWNQNIINPEIDSYISGEMNFMFGAEWKLSSNWQFITEFSYHSLSGKLDGISNTNRTGILGSYNDGYISVNAGFQYRFVKGEASKYCELCSGIKVDVPRVNYPTLEQIESIIKRYSEEPENIDYAKIEEIIKQYQADTSETNSNVLFGINFESGKSGISVESYPVLDHSVEVLLKNTDWKVEIQGYTDSIGTDSGNQKISEMRANAVKDYMVSKGIAPERLTAVGMGELNPAAENTTALGRAKNRRVEFKVSK
jgi:OOP family OmpA-OmpF porin